jgi:hypothetical protein
VQENPVQIRNVEPETAALAAAEEEAILSLGELDHLDVVARAIHVFACSPGAGSLPPAM